MIFSKLWIAVHAVLVQTDGCGEIIEEETSWGGPCGIGWTPGDPVPFPFFEFGGSSWSYYRLLVLTFPIV